MVPTALQSHWGVLLYLFLTVVPPYNLFPVICQSLLYTVAWSYSIFHSDIFLCLSLSPLQCLLDTATSLGPPWSCCSDKDPLPSPDISAIHIWLLDSSTHSLQLSATDQFKPPLSPIKLSFTSSPLPPSHWDYPLERRWILVCQLLWSSHSNVKIDSHSNATTGFLTPIICLVSVFFLRLVRKNRPVGHMYRCKNDWTTQSFLMFSLSTIDRGCGT